MSSIFVSFSFRIVSSKGVLIRPTQQFWKYLSKSVLLLLNLILCVFPKFVVEV